MFPDIYLGSLAYALGDLEEPVETAATEGRLLSTASALREAGFGQHHRCSSGVTGYDLARQAVKTISSEVRGTDLVVYATSLPMNGNVGSEEAYRSSRDVKYVMDFPASHLQADFDLGGAMVLGVNQLACASLLAAIRTAAMILRSEAQCAKALCVTADRFPEGALYEQSYNLISDGAAACVITKARSEFRILGGHGITNGAMAFASDDQTVGSYFTYTHRMITELLGRKGLAIEDVGWIVPQNVNLVTWKVLSSLLRFDPKRVLFPTMPRIGHMISGDNVVNLYRLLAERRFAPGDKILLPMAGYGLNWQCLLLGEDLMDERTLHVVERLCGLSREKATALGSAIEWPAERDRDAWYTSPELLSVHEIAAAERLSEAQLRELSFFEALNFYSLNIHGEKFLLDGLASRLHRQDFARTTEYLHHFIDEENKHLFYFGTFCVRYGGKVYSHAHLAFPREYARGEEDFLFFAKVLLFEELVDYYNSRMASDARLAPVAREVNRLHHLDETRHLAFGRLLVKDLFDRHRSAWSRETLATVRATLRGFVEAIWRQYYNPEAYGDAGIADPHEMARRAYASGRAHRTEVTRRSMAFLASAGILEEERT